jgi:hypothetical protein
MPFVGECIFVVDKSCETRFIPVSTPGLKPYPPQVLRDQSMAIPLLLFAAAPITQSNYRATLFGAKCHLQGAFRVQTQSRARPRTLVHAPICSIEYDNINDPIIDSERQPQLIINTEPSRYSLGRVLLEQPVVPIVVVVLGSLLLRYLVALVVPCLPDVGQRDIDILVTGVFMPCVGILFGTLSSTAISVLRQRQQDARDLLNQELAAVRMLSQLLTNPDLLRLLLEYTRTMDAETFSHRANGIYYFQNAALTASPMGRQREAVFEYAEEILWTLLEKVNTLRLRSDVESIVRDLVSLRTRRRAILDTGFPSAHFNIIGALGLSIIFSFIILLAGEASWMESLIVRVVFGILLGVLAWGAVLIADLRDPFQGKYRLSNARMRRTLYSIEKSLGN